MRLPWRKRTEQVCYRHLFEYADVAAIPWRRCMSCKREERLWLAPSWEIAPIQIMTDDDWKLCKDITIYCPRNRAEQRVMRRYIKAVGGDEAWRTGALVGGVLGLEEVLSLFLSEGERMYDL